MVTRSLKNRILISFFTIIFVLSLSTVLLGYYVMKVDIIEKAQAKVRNDLNSAREIYSQETKRLKDVVRFTALRFFMKDSIASNDTETLKKKLEDIRKTESLDVLTLTDEAGRVVIRSQNPAVNSDNQAQDETVSRLLSNMEAIAGTVIVPPEELIKEGEDLAEQASIAFVPTLKAKPSLRTEIL